MKMPCKVVLGTSASIAVVAALVGCGDSSSTPAPVASATATNIPPARACESLATLSIPSVIITSAASVAAGTYTPPGSTTSFTNLPDFCRVTATSSPVAGSSISLEIWLPSKIWNGRYMQVGTHGTGGQLYWSEMAPQLRRGFVTGATDTGHPFKATFDSTWAIGNPQKLVDYGYRSSHELVDKAKTIIASYYGMAQSFAYFNGCSFGGNNGLQEAQRYPSDFNGILVGGAGADSTGAGTAQLVQTTALVNAGIVGASGAAILTLAQKAAISACDAQDGVVDGIIANPTRCKWDPTSMICKAGQDPSTCFTPTQANAIKTVTADVTNPVTGAYVFGGLQPGSEHDVIKYGLALSPFGTALYQIAKSNPTWDPTTFNLNVDYPGLVANVGTVIDALNPDLSTFKAVGGKLLQWHTWDDSQFTPKFTVDYYNQVASTQGGVEVTQTFYRLFMMPAQGHCAGGATPEGTGPSNIGAENQIAVSPDAEHDAVTALMQWVEQDSAPQLLIASRYKNNDTTQAIDMQRPLCPYPLEAIFKGSGDTNQASSFYCGTPATSSNP
ncbi:tannase/feruloyl esterase family alpha/beta hydrolase [Caballeronia sp. DA-9]|uniref:tannase/feruloyl esterase family alpha/beta hydrolase n=1 Tax=Caballeronia sp. DA-9 TaxID=3436237 RepID=UPI003F667D7E